MKGSEVILIHVELVKIINTHRTEHPIIEKAKGAISKSKKRPQLKKLPHMVPNVTNSTQIIP